MSLNLYPYSSHHTGFPVDNTEWRNKEI